MLPDWVAVLRFLDRPLNFAPATDTMVFALRTYAGVSLDVAPISWIVGTLLLTVGYIVSVRALVRTTDGRYRWRERTALRNS
jgi:hypothetical protein